MLMSKLEFWSNVLLTRRVLFYSHMQRFWTVCTSAVFVCETVQIHRACERKAPLGKTINTLGMGANLGCHIGRRCALWPFLKCARRRPPTYRNRPTSSTNHASQQACTEHCQTPTVRHANLSNSGTYPACLGHLPDSSRMIPGCYPGAPPDAARALLKHLAPTQARVICAHASASQSTSCG